MPATIIMGGQWGDEGKGKLTDALATRAHLVIRANGGANAGHTIDTPAGVFKMHLVPSGILNPDCICVIGAGVVIEPAALIREMDGLIDRGVSLDRLTISERAHLVLPVHPLIDTLEEAARGGNPIGTTKRGNGPAYADKMARRGLRVGDILDPSTLRGKVDLITSEKNAILTGVYGHAPLEADELFEMLKAAGERLRPHIAATEIVVQDALADGKHALVECAQGAMLDIDYGTYPYVTSSSPTAAGACQGAGVAPTQIERVVAVYKAYGTRVGSGAFPTELTDETGNLIRERGREYGTTTGRPRRTGWFDGVAGRTAARLNGVTEVALTLLDVLDVFPEIKVSTAYRDGNSTIHHVPARHEQLLSVQPVYATIPGWQEDTTGARQSRDLPEDAMTYVRFLQSQLAAPITMVGVGPSRDQLVPLSADAAMNTFGS